MFDKAKARVWSATAESKQPTKDMVMFVTSSMIAAESLKPSKWTNVNIVSMTGAVPSHQPHAIISKYSTITLMHEDFPPGS